MTHEHGDARSRKLGGMVGNRAPEAAGESSRDPFNPSTKGGDVVERVAAAICDGMTNGNATLGEMPAHHQDSYREAARCALVAMSAWQPISTAPTNASVLIFLPNAEHYGHGVYRAMLVDMGTGRRWMTSGWAVGRDLGVYEQPTHWMPLPEPPNTETPSGRALERVAADGSAGPGMSEQALSTVRGEGSAQVSLTAGASDLSEPGKSGERADKRPVFLRAECGVRYWEDAAVNGVVDENGDLIPFRVGDTWMPLIELATGQIVGWPATVAADIHYKVCDAGRYTLLDGERNPIQTIDGYVPDMLSPGGSGYGDYVIMKVHGGGQIENWHADLTPFTETVT